MAPLKENSKKSIKKQGKRKRLGNKKEQETTEVALKLEEQKVLLGEAEIQNIGAAPSLEQVYLEGLDQLPDQSGDFL